MIRGWLTLLRRTALRICYECSVLRSFRSRLRGQVDVLELPDAAERVLLLPIAIHMPLHYRMRVWYAI